MHTQKRPCEHENIDQGDASTSQGLYSRIGQRLPANHQKLRERRETDSPSQPSAETNPANTLILDFWCPEL